MPDRRLRLTSALSKVLAALLVLWLATSATAQNNPPSGVEQEAAPASPVRRPPVPTPLPPLGTRRLPIAPDLVGLSVANAEARVRAFNLGLRVRDERAAEVGATIASQDPIAGTRMKPRGIITVTMTPAVVLAEVPDITQTRIREAQRAVAAANLLLRFANEANRLPNSALPDSALVVSQEPRAHRRVKPGSTVMATVELPPQMTLVPKIVGLKIQAAADSIRPSLLLSTPPTGEAWPSDATVATQFPEPGQRAPVGSLVTITVTIPAPPPTRPTAPPTALPAAVPPSIPPAIPTIAPPFLPPPAPLALPPSASPSELRPDASDLVSPVLWSVTGTVLVAVLGVAGWNRRQRHRRLLPVRISLGREANRGRVVGRDGGTLAAGPAIGVRIGAGPTVTAMRPMTRSD